MKDARELNDSIIGQTFLEKELNNSDIIQTAISFDCNFAIYRNLFR